MEKKSYFKPAISRTEIDYSITLTQSSNDGADPNDPNCTICPPIDPEFLNPMKWFK